MGDQEEETRRFYMTHCDSTFHQNLRMPSIPYADFPLFKTHRLRTPGSHDCISYCPPCNPMEACHLSSPSDQLLVMIHPQDSIPLFSRRSPRYSITFHQLPLTHVFQHSPMTRLVFTHDSL